MQTCLLLKNNIMRTEKEWRSKHTHKHNHTHTHMRNNNNIDYDVK